MKLEPAEASPCALPLLDVPSSCCEVSGPGYRARVESGARLASRGTTRERPWLGPVCQAGCMEVGLVSEEIFEVREEGVPVSMRL